MHVNKLNYRLKRIAAVGHVRPKDPCKK
ncbi:hypothetical protein JNUCC23_05580 [Peribacillus sp. JNUCC 23]